MKDIVKENNNNKVKQIVSKNINISLTDSLVGILKEDTKLEEIRDEYISEKYGLTFQIKISQII